MMSWMITASRGATPANKRPVMAPGRAIKPTTFVLSTCGMSASRAALGAKYRETAARSKTERQRRFDLANAVARQRNRLIRPEHRRRHRVSNRDA